MKFRKKPVVIEAWRFARVGSGFVGQPGWLRNAIQEGAIYYQGGDAPFYTIETLEGSMCANFGDWIIRDVKGELYPCKHDIFEATYEAA